MTENTRLPYGHDHLSLDLSYFSGSIQVLGAQSEDSPHPDAVSEALAAPIASQRLRERVHRGQKVAIITSDVTRPCPSHLMLPPVLNELSEAGVRDEDIFIVFALGLHRAQSPAEHAKIVGEAVYKRIRCLDGDPNKTVHIGTTHRGTPVDIFEDVAKADFRIALGNIEPHYFAGYTGGVKALMPGVCSARTIRANHSLMFEEGADPGVLEGNPVREDLEEGAGLLGVDFIVNVILNTENQILAAVAGDATGAHRRGCAIVRSRLTTLDMPADCVVVSAGGFPKDINLYQAQKALDNASRLVKRAGKILLVAECGEGFGNAVFEEWLTHYSADEAISRLKANFQLGGHKAYAIAKIAAKIEVGMVSRLPAVSLQSAGIHAFASIDEGADRMLRTLPPSASLVVMPHGAATMAALAQP